MPQNNNSADSKNETIWILGGGQFGQHAVTQLMKKYPASTITVIDNQRITNLPDVIQCIEQDGVEWLVENFQKDTPVTKIIPALPLHLAAEWLLKKLLEQSIPAYHVEIPDDLVSSFPHPIRLSPSHIAVSHADFLCPSHCSEQKSFCTHTKKPRATPLYQLLGMTKSNNFIPIILRSRQFGPGVGGFHREDLWELLKKVTSMPNSTFLIGTACKCHGIIDGIRNY